MGEASEAPKKQPLEQTAKADAPVPKIQPEVASSEQLKSAKSTNNPVQSEVLVKKGLIPGLAIEQSEAKPQETAIQRQLRTFYQTRLSDNLQIFAVPEVGQSTEQGFQDGVKRQKEEILAEQKKGEFGPASQKAYGQYLDWLQKATVPGVFAKLNDLNLAAPPGSPVVAQKGDTDLRALAAAGRLPGDFLKIDRKKAPTLEEAQRIENALEWVQKSTNSINEVQGAQQDKRLDEIIHRQGLPLAWQYKEGGDKIAWRASAREMVDLAVRTTREVDAMDRLHRAGGRFALELPPGAILKRDESGKITKVHLDLPQDLRQSDPRNEAKIERLRKWLDEKTPKIQQAVNELTKGQDNTSTAFSWGGTEVSSVRDDGGKRLSAQGLFDKDDHLLRVIDPRKIKPGDIPAGGSVKDINLLDQRFDVTTLPNGDIQVNQTVQAEKVPWYGYQNLGAAHVGHEMEIGQQTFKPDDFVTVSNGGKLEVIPARDLQQWKQDQQLFYYGGKTISVAMDIAMVASGTVEVGAALKAGRLLAAGIETAGALSAKQALRTGMEGTARATMGLAGLGNNAELRNTDLGEAIESIRSKYFLLDSARGLTQLSKLGSAAKLTEGLGREEKVRSIIEGTTWMKSVDRLATPTFKALEVPITLQVGGDLYDQIKNIAAPQDPNLAKSAVEAFGDGKGMQQARANSFDNSNPQSLDSARAVLNEYKAILSRSPGEEKRVAEILDKTAALLDAKVSQPEREQFATRLANSLVFTRSQIEQLEKVNPDKENRLTPEQLQSLANAEERPSYPNEALKAEAEKIMRDTDKSVRAAEEIALLYLARDKDGHIPEQLTTATLTMPSVEKLRDQMVVAFVGSSGVEKVPTMLPEEKVQLKITPQMLTDDLRGMLENERNRVRAIAAGDVLLRTGSITHAEYGAALQNILLNTSASKADKMQALVDDAGPRMAAIIAGLEQEEAERKKSGLHAETALGQSFGATSSDLKKTLATVAAKDSDPDVRAMAAAITFGLELQKHNPRTGSTVLNSFDQVWTQSKNQPGTFAKTVSDVLQQTIFDTRSLANGMQAAAAAKALLTLSKDCPELHKTCISVITDYGQKHPGEILGNLHALSDKQRDDLDTSAPELAAKLRDQALSLMHEPRSFAQEQNLANEIPFLAKVLHGGTAEQQKTWQQRLQSFVTSTAETANFDRLRTSSINQLTISGAGDEKSIAAFRDAATSDASAMVREAAINALAKLHDAKLVNMLPQLIEKETDATNLSRLRDLQADLAGQIIVPDLTAEATQSEDTLLRSKHLKDFRGLNERKWLDTNFPLLNQQTFAGEAANAAAGNHPFHWDTLLGSGDPTFYDEMQAMKRQRRATENSDAIQKVQKEREQQFNDLCRMAKGEAADPNSDKAKKLLQDILVSGGKVIGRTDKLTIAETDYQIEESTQLWQSKAASALTDAATLGNNGRDLLVRYVASDLANPAVCGAARQKLLAAWTKLTAPEEESRGDASSASSASSDRLPISKRLAQQVINTAAMTEARRSSKEQDETFQLGLLKASTLNESASTRASLQLLMQATQFDSVRQRISQILDGNNIRTGT